MPRLFITDSIGERELTTGDEVVTIGRSTKSTIVIRDQNSSREHGQIRKVGDAWSIVDLNSRNGTVVNGCPINEQKLKHGDRIEIGSTTILFVADAVGGAVPPPLPQVAPKGPPPLRPELLRSTREEQCYLEVLEGERAGERFHLVGEPLTIGRAKTNSVSFQDDRISNRHAEVAYDPASGMYLARDLGSTNGTKVNGEKVQAQVLRSGSILDLGGLRLKFQDPKAPGPEEDHHTPPSLVALSPVRGAAASPTPAGGPGVFPRPRAGGPSATPTPRSGSPALGRAGGGGAGRRAGPLGGGPFLVGILATVLLLGGAYFALPPILRLFVPKPVKVLVDPESLVKNNASFEETQKGEAELFPGWDVKGDPGELYRADTHNAKHGQTCLLLQEFKEAGRPSRYMKATYREVLSLERGSVYEVDAWLRTENSLGGASLEAEWLGPKGEALGQSYTDVFTGYTPWTQVRHPFVPPDDATGMRLSCVALGQFGKAWFDDLAVFRRSLSDETRPFRLKSAAMTAEFGDRGLVSFYSGDRRLLASGEVRLWTQAGKCLRQGLAALDEGFPRRAAGSYTSRSRLLDLATGDAVELTTGALSTAKGVAVSYRAKAPKGIGADQVQLVLAFTPGALSDGISLKRHDKSVVEHGAFPETDEISGVVLGGAAHPLTLSFGCDVVVTAVEEAGAMRLVVTWPPELLAGPAAEFGVEAQ
ncbi:MAG: FHA domain-containing protein [Planctomycetes bacterium]|nr:FHA domain-containing protein [Planctomycetota bacterium]